MTPTPTPQPLPVPTPSPTAPVPTPPAPTHDPTPPSLATPPQPPPPPPIPKLPVIVFRAQDYHDAAQEFDAISEDSKDTHVGLAMVMNSVTGMAGDDDMGKAWGEQYDKAARLAMATSSQLGESCIITRNLIATGVYNHAVGEADANHSNTTPPEKPSLRADVDLNPTIGSAIGKGQDDPFGWSIVKLFVDGNWPNGYPDKLRGAADAWHNASADFRTLATAVTGAVDLLGNNQSPEIGPATDACNQRKADFNDLADACQTLGDTCNGYAQEIDDAQTNIVLQLATLTAGNIAIELISGAFAPETVGGSEFLGNAAVAARAPIVGKSISKIIADLATKVANMIKDVVKPLGERIKPIFARVRKWVDAAKEKIASALGKSDVVDGKTLKLDENGNPIPEDRSGPGENGLYPEPTGDDWERIRQAAQDKADSLPRPPKNGSPTMASALEMPDGTIFTGSSNNAVDLDKYPALKNIINSIPEDNQSDFSWKCAEIDSIAQALDNGYSLDDIQGAKSSAAQVRGPNSNTHGNWREPCKGDKYLLGVLGIGW